MTYYTHLDEYFVLYRIINGISYYISNFSRVAYVYSKDCENLTSAKMAIKKNGDLTASVGGKVNNITNIALDLFGTNNCFLINKFVCKSKLMKKKFFNLYNNKFCFPIKNLWINVLLNHQYYSTKLWYFVRMSVFSIYDNKCLYCESTKNLVCHHKDYRYFGEGGKKEIKDCECLCKKCHTLIHNYFRCKNINLILF